MRAFVLLWTVECLMRLFWRGAGELQKHEYSPAIIIGGLKRKSNYYSLIREEWRYLTVIGIR